MSTPKFKKEDKKPETTKPPVSGGQRAAPVHREFEQLNGKSGNLLKAIKDAKSWITGKYNIPVQELEDGIIFSDIDFMQNLLTLYPPTRPKREEENTLSVAQEAEIDGILRGGEEGEEEGEAEERAGFAHAVREQFLAENLREIRDFNYTTQIRNELMKSARDLEQKKHAKLATQRPAACLWLMAEWMTESVRRRVELDPVYVPVSKSNFSTPFEIFQICTRLFSDREPELLIRQENAQETLKKVTMFKPNGFVPFNTAFRNAMETLSNTGKELDDVLLITYYAKGLNNTVFGEVKKDMDIPSKKALYPTTFAEFVMEMEQIQDRYDSSGKSHQDADAMRVLKTDAKESSGEKHSPAKGAAGKAQSEKSAGKGAKSEKWPKCVHCEKNHPGECWSEEALVKAHETRLEALRLARAERNKAKNESGGGETKKNHHFVARNRDVLPDLFEPEEQQLSLVDVSVHSTSCQGVGPNEIDFIFDNAADIGLISDPSLGINQRQAQITLEGAVPGATIEVDSKLDLLHGLGTALVVGSTNIVSDWEITGKFDRAYTGEHSIRLTSRETGKIWDFVRDPACYGDLKFHCTLDRVRYEVMSFYQPRRVRETNLSEVQQKSIEDAIHIHRMLGHPDDQVLAAMIKSNPDIGATVEGLRLWRSTDGPCSGCTQGKMTSHAKAPSTKPSAQPGHYEVGEAAGGDVYYLDKRPYNLMVDIESGFICDDAILGHTLGDFKESFNRLLAKWKLCGKALKILKFDRESAVVRARRFLEEEHGLKLELAAAGQHQPHAEKAIGIIKDRMRSIKSGIKDRYGYDFNLTEKLREDAIKCIQRTFKRGQDKSPLEIFGGATIDLQRDLRAELGEIILVERPKRGAARDLSTKAEWAVVVGRAMDGSGILEVLILSSMRIAHRLKFSRSRVPSEVLHSARMIKQHSSFSVEEEFMSQEELRRLYQAPLPASSSDEVMETESIVAPDVNPVEAAFVPAEENAPTEEMIAGAEMEHNEGATTGEGEAEGASDLQDAEPVEPVVPTHSYNTRSKKSVSFAEEIHSLYSILAGQVRYKQALLSEHAEAARESMKKEVKQAIEMKVFHGVYFGDLTSEEKKKILPSTSLYKEKYFPSGEFEKAKCRMLVRGDMQKPEFTGESSSPTARVETVFWLLSVGVFLEQTFFKIDFIGAYLNTPRPEEV